MLSCRNKTASTSATITLNCWIGVDSVPPSACVKLAEFAKGPVTVTLLATSGAQERTQVADLLPGAFDLDHLTAGAEDPKA